MFESFKRGQGVVVRRVAFWSFAILIVWGCRSLYDWLINSVDFCRTLLLGGDDYLGAPRLPVLDQRLDVGFVISWGLAALFLWLLYRVLNKPRSADFLIETDGELKKVTWPSWNEAWSSTKVVVVFVIALTIFLLIADFGLKNLVGFIL